LKGWGGGEELSYRFSVVFSLSRFFKEIVAQDNLASFFKWIYSIWGPEFEAFAHGEAQTKPVA
jgi:hypothetical protein